MNRTVGMAIPLMLAAFFSITACDAQGRSFRTSSGCGDYQAFRGPAQRNTFVANVPSYARYALVIGVESYPGDSSNLASLQGPNDDAQRLADDLIKYAKFGNVCLMTSDAKRDEDRPRRSNILKRLSDIISHMDEGSLLLIYFAGHGLSDKDQVFLMTEDSAYGKSEKYTKLLSLPLAELSDLIFENGKAIQVVFLLDACRTKINRLPSEPKGNILVPAFRRILSSGRTEDRFRGYAVFFATGIYQRAFSPRDEQNIGAEADLSFFAQALSEALRGGVHRRAVSSSCNVTLKSLEKYVIARVPELFREYYIKKKGLDPDLDVIPEQQPVMHVDGFRLSDLVLADGDPDLAVPCQGFSFAVEVNMTPSIRSDSNATSQLGTPLSSFSETLSITRPGTHTEVLQFQYPYALPKGNSISWEYSVRVNYYDGKQEFSILLSNKRMESNGIKSIVSNDGKMQLNLLDAMRGWQRFCADN